MRMIKLPDGKWIRSDHVVLIEPTWINITGEQGEDILRSKLRVVAETQMGLQEFEFATFDGDQAFEMAGKLAMEIMTNK